MAPAAIANAGASIRSHEAYRAGQALGDATIDRVVDAVTADDDDADGREGEFQVVDDRGFVIGNKTPEEFDKSLNSKANVMQTVRIIGGGMIGLAVLVVVLNEIFSINSISSSSGPFSGIIDSLESTGVAALSLLVIGFLVLAANRIMGFFGAGGF